MRKYDDMNWSCDEIAPLSNGFGKNVSSHLISEISAVFELGTPHLSNVELI